MKALRGMSLIDVIVGSALVLIVFVGLIGLLRASLLISGVAKARAGATAIADNQIEYIRALDYDLVGTIGGIPSGIVTATSTQTLNGVVYNTRTLIVYVDDPADGLGAADTNTITTDYKQIKVEVTYSIRKSTKSIAIISNYAPQSIETTTNGGTLSIAVVGSTGVPLPGATVAIVNDSLNPTVNFTTFSDASGFVQLPGAPTSTEYRITVSKSGYSSAQTYARDATNQNPTPGYLTVAKNQTTTSTFAIDLLNSFTLRTFSPIASASTTDTFSSSAQIATTTNAQVASGAITLSSSGSGYALSGSAFSTPTSPAYLSAWSAVNATLSLPSGTTARIYVTDAAGALISDAILSGNSSGYTSFPVSLSTISTSTYPTLGLSADLTTNSTTTTPQVLDWRLTYEAGPTPLPNIPFTLTGAKTVGTTGAGVPIYKTTIASTTGAMGVYTEPLEWDAYSIIVSGYTIDVASSTPTPFTLDPGGAFSASIILN